MQNKGSPSLILVLLGTRFYVINFPALAIVMFLRVSHQCRLRTHDFTATFVLAFVFGLERFFSHVLPLQLH